MRSASWLLVLGLGLSACGGTNSVVGTVDAAIDDIAVAPKDVAADAPGVIDAATTDAPAPDAPEVTAQDAPAELSLEDTSDAGSGRCRDNTDCAANEFGQRVCEVATGRCVTCLPGVPGGCSEDQYCTAANRCEAGCERDAQCARDGGTFRCDTARHACVGCTRDDQCAPGSICGAGAECVPGCSSGQACPAGETCCSGACRRVEGDVENCGACGRMCAAPNGAAACRAGACAVAACDSGRGDCDGEVGNGCEADLGSAVAHCGACGNACATGPNAAATCARGRCELTCAAGFADCDSDASNGCEVDTRSATAHCGACGNTCAAGANATASCAAGRCVTTCAAGFGDCDGNPANGCEANLQSDPARCGTCTTTCAGGTNARPLCAAGICQIACVDGFANCDGNATNGCEASLDGTASCGACGTLCGGGAPLCAPSGGGFACSSGCSGAEVRCGSSCVDTQRAVNDCGGCGDVCPAVPNAARTCAAGRCGFACNDGFADCDGDPSNGCEVFLGTATAHCGMCRNACAAGANATATCALGRCVLACAAGFADCDGDAGNGCEVDTRSSATSCGVCGRACPNVANGAPRCAGGVCGATCDPGYADCDGNPANGCEVETDHDPRNCGACGQACAAGFCDFGRCGAQPTCRAILQAQPGAASGPYTIDPDGDGGAMPITVYCDMTTDGGGWTLVAYASRGSVSALSSDTGVRNLYSLATGGGAYDGVGRRGVASLAAVPIARRAREMLLARANADYFTGPIAGYDVATKFTIPDPSTVNFLNSNPYVNLPERGPCVPVTITTLRGPDATGAMRYVFRNTLSVSWTDTYPTSYGVMDTSNCYNGSLGPNFVSDYTGVGNTRSYPWPQAPNGSAHTYWHRGWWDPTQTSRTGSVSIWLR